MTAIQPMLSSFEAILLKGGAVMWPLLVCSLISLTISCERLLYWRKPKPTKDSEHQFPDSGRKLLDMDRGLFALDTIITMAPLLGILGTVLGIIDCFGFLSKATFIDPSLISSGIAQALVSTAAGLSVSLMTLIPYNWFLEKQRREVMRIMALKGEK